MIFIRESSIFRHFFKFTLSPPESSVYSFEFYNLLVQKEPVSEFFDAFEDENHGEDLTSHIDQKLAEIPSSSKLLYGGVTKGDVSREQTLGFIWGLHLAHIKWVHLVLSFLHDGVKVQYVVVHP